MSGEVPRWQQALFERRGLGVKLDLEAIRAVYRALGAPCAQVPGLHVVGTNGKGSTSAMAAHALQRRGRRVGLYTSPHLHRVGERVRIDGVAVTDEALQGLCDRVLAAEAAGPRALTFFEVLTLAALLAFETGGVDAIVLEAGLGGRLDATRVFANFSATLFTPIALDHTMYLGPTIAAIAGEKAAVMADGAPAFSAPQTAEAEEVLRAVARTCGVRLTFVVGLERAPLAGAHQRINAGLALVGAREIEPTVLVEDLEGVVWPGRLERRRVGGGSVVFDVAHNPHGMAALVEHLRGVEVGERAVLFGCLADKDAPAMVAELARLGCPLWLAPAPGGAAFAVAELAEGLADARVFAGLEDPRLADARAELLARGGELVVCGSHHVVGHVRGELLAVTADARTLSDPR